MRVLTWEKCRVCHQLKSFELSSRTHKHFVVTIKKKPIIIAGKLYSKKGESMCVTNTPLFLANILISLKQEELDSSPLLNEAHI